MFGSFVRKRQRPLETSPRWPGRVRAMSDAPHLERFFRAFAAKDFATMNACYADDASFTDPVFVDLKGAEVRGMWTMLLSGASDDFRIEFKDLRETLQADGTTVGEASWTAKYTFSATKRPVINHVKSRVVLRDGKIVDQRDTFPLDTWLKQALGLPGTLFGGFGFFQRFFQKKVRARLLAFVAKRGA